MKIQVLNFEELEQPQSNAPDQSDDTAKPAAEEAEISSTAEDEVSSTAEDTSDADEAQVEAIESQLLVLEDLYQSWAKSGRLTPRMLHEANESIPSLRITHGHYSHEKRYSLAMEGVVNKAWEAMKKFWEQIKNFFAKLAAYVKRVLSGTDAPAITENDKNALVTLLTGAKQRFEQSIKAMPLKHHPDEDRIFVKNFNAIGGERGAELLKLSAQVVPQVKAYAEAITQYINSMKGWFDAENRGEKKPLPSGMGTIMPEFKQQLEKVDAMSKAVRNGTDSGSHAKASVAGVMGMIQHLHVAEGDAGNGLMAALSAAHALGDSQWKAINAVSPETYPALDNQMDAMKGVREAMAALRMASSVILDMRNAERLVLNLGHDWLRAVKEAFDSAGLFADQKPQQAQYSDEATEFSILASKYQSLLKEHNKR